MVNSYHMSTPDMRLASGLSPHDSARYMETESSILKSFVSELGHGPMEIRATNKQLENSMRAEMESRKLTCDQLERTLHLAASLIELAYYERSFSEKMNMALYNWFLIYVDDMAPKDPSTFSVFAKRYLSGQPQLDPVLDALVGVLHRMWDLYDPLCASSIISATLEFFTGTCLESDIEKLPLIRGTQRFSWFVRECTGVATAFALMMFTKSSGINMMEYVQAIPDMNFWIAVTNDILSFHKEQLAGETANYFHTKGYIENKAPLLVLAETAEEARVSRNIIHTALSQSPRALRAWKFYEQGYVAWHLGQERYKLRDLDI